MIRNRYLPQPLRRIASGILGAAVTATIACVALRYVESDSWWHTASEVLLWLSVPIGVVLSFIAHRFSLVEGCAGEAGYENLESDNESKPPE